MELWIEILPIWKRVDIMIQFFSGLKQFKITQQQVLGVNNSCFISLKRFPCAMLGDNCHSKITCNQNKMAKTHSRSNRIIHGHIYVIHKK